MSEQQNWSLKMHNIESCSCNHGCGCQFAGFPTSEDGGCQAIIGYEVIEGHLNELDLAGVKMVLVASWPKAMHEGNGDGALFIDKSATAEQVSAMATIMSGQHGGMPVTAIASLFSAFDGPIMADIKLKVNEFNSTVAIDGILEAEQTPHVNPVTGDENRVHITYPGGGFLWNDGKVGRTKALKVNHGNIAFNFDDTFAANAIVNWPNG
ncbi:DUF1326 domain-containing protein [Thalassotalea litorea]|uniref:DUF1326 domain-containing protein n=1 Tax=Thalassotalea litorea TaxID=2020715 RepID=A0A5R9ITD5_9GAMM|nr:DUF1326 domain-containing protein [Thalassotalea litorea]TLU67357.1 DUF1326 domain-containing protein [Thalassotalea litorea]